MLKDAFILLPPIDEQKAIVAYLDDICQRIDASIDKANGKIKNLQELRTRIIGDAVTGAIDVRGIEIPNYEYVDEDMTDTDEENESEELTEEQEE